MIIYAQNVDAETVIDFLLKVSTVIKTENVKNWTKITFETSETSKKKKKRGPKIKIDQNLIIQLRKNKLSYAEIAKNVGCARSYAYKVCSSSLAAITTAKEEDNKNRTINAFLNDY